MLTCEFNALELRFNGVNLTAEHLTSEWINRIKTIGMDENSGSPSAIIS